MKGTAKLITCQKCGAKTVQRSQAQKYCPECSRLARKESQTAYKRRISGSRPPKTKENPNLVKASIEANSLHISYGQYMRMRSEARA